MPLSRSTKSLRSRFLHFELQAFDLTDDHLLADADPRRRMRVPQFALDEDLAFGIDVGARFPKSADQALLAGDDFGVTGAKRNGHQEDRDRAQRYAHSQSCPDAHPHLRDWPVHQKQSPEREQGDAEKAKNSMSCELGLQRK